MASKTVARSINIYMEKIVLDATEKQHLLKLYN